MRKKNLDPSMTQKQFLELDSLSPYDKMLVVLMISKMSEGERIILARMLSIESDRLDIRHWLRG